MRQFVVRDLYRIAIVVALVGHEKPGLLQTRDGTAKRAADIVVVEVGGGIRIQRALSIGYSLLILNREAGESGVLVVIKSRTMEWFVPRFVVTRMLEIPAYSALKSFERTFNSPTASSDGSLAEAEPSSVLVDRCPSMREVRAVTLESKKLERPIAGTLRDIRVQIEE